MVKSIVKAALVAAFLLLPVPAQASQHRLLVDVPYFHDANNVVCVGPRGSDFTIVNDDGTNVIVRFTKVKDLRSAFLPAYTKTVQVAAPQPVATGRNYTIEKGLLPDYNYQFLAGFAYGILTVPFKLQLDDGAVSAGATVGGYAGWKIRRTTLLASAGLSTIPIQDINAGTVVTKAGLTGAGGIVIDVGKGFQIGGVVGVDHIGDPTYPYENKFWLSFGMGFGFTR